jgi:hypothetical protein
MALGKYSSALTDYEYVSNMCRFRKMSIVLMDAQVKKACPQDKDAAMKYEECKKIVTRIRFEKAIAVDDAAKSVANQIDLASMSMYLLHC